MSNQIQLIHVGKNITAGNDAMNTFTNATFPVRWVVLSAQMQSGKTFVYTFVAAEMLRRKKVDKIVIFCGNPEIALREQTKECFDRKFKGLYRQYLASIHVEQQEIDDVIDTFSERGVLEVIFGTQLTSKKAKTQQRTFSKTLFIWDESHYAQNQGMCVDQFLEGVGILPNGDFRPLEQKNNYVLSVSATAFSEISDVAHCSQGKQVITFIPSDAYIGVKKMIEKNMIVSFDDVSVCVREQLLATLDRFGDTKKFGIVRIPHESTKDTKGESIRDDLEQFAIANGWDIKHYFQSDKKLESLNILENAPESGKNTLILVKDLCRMGQVLKKDHISFVIETATDSNTDVILQGLLGRMCGYDSNDQIRICLRTKFVESGELEKYVTMTESRTELPETMPSKARNLTAEPKQIFAKPIIHMRITRAHRTLDGSAEVEITSGNLSKEYRTARVEAAATAVLTGRMDNYNDEEITQKVKDIVKKNELLSKKWRFREINATHARRICETIRTGIPCLGESGANSCVTSENDEADENKISLWYTPKAFPEFGIEEGTWFINTNVCIPPLFETSLPNTTRKEVFCRMTEAGETIQSNGQFAVDLPPGTATNVNQMCDVIMEAIQISTRPQVEGGLTFQRKLTSNKISETEFQGIYVTNEVLTALKKNGQIYQTVKDRSRLTLRIKQVPILDDPSTMIRLSEISW